MRAISTVLVVGAIIGLATVRSVAQSVTGSATGKIETREIAPTDRVVDLTLEDLEAVVKAMPAKDLATTRLLEGGAWSVNIRLVTTPELAHVHPTTVQIYVVREGSGLMVSGGTIVDAKGQPVPAGQNGTDLKGGVERTIKAGDIIVTPPGVPHFIREVKHIVFMNIQFNLKP